MGEKIITNRGGRPRLERAKRLLTIRIDQEVFDRFVADGPGYLTRINSVLAEWARNAPPPKNAKPDERRA